MGERVRRPLPPLTLINASDALRPDHGTMGECPAVPSGQAPPPRSGAPQARGSTATTRAERDSLRPVNNAAMGLQPYGRFGALAEASAAPRRGALGMAFINGTNIRAYHKAAGAEKSGPMARSEMCAGRFAVLAAVWHESQSPRAVVERSPSRWRRARRTNCRWRAVARLLIRRGGLTMGDTGLLPMLSGTCSGRAARDQ